MAEQKTLELFGLPLDQSAASVVDDFVGAVSRRDREALEGCLTREALAGAENSPRGLARQMGRKKLELRLMPVGKCEAGRASVRALITSSEDPNLLQSLWFLCVKKTEWKIGGVTRSRSLVGLFLRGEIGAHESIRDLSLDPTVDEWMKHHGHERLESWLAASGGTIGRLHAGPGHSIVHRGLIPLFEGLGDESSPPRACVIVEKENGDWKYHDIRRGAAMETMVMDMDVPWTSADEESNDGQNEIQ